MAPRDSTQSREQILLFRDGTPVRLRMVRPDDRRLLQRGVREMSNTSRFMRFFASTREMTDEQAHHFSDIDQIQHVAVCAVEPTIAEQRAGLPGLCAQ